MARVQHRGIVAAAQRPRELVRERERERARESGGRGGEQEGERLNFPGGKR